MTVRWRSIGYVLLLASFLTGPLVANQPAEPPGEFVPISELPPGDELPAAPLLIAAYAFVWLVLFLYLYSLWRRIQKVNADLAALARRIERRD
jgi:CcmD family protein